VVELTEEQLREEHGGWLGPNPYYLMIVLAAGRHAEIDLDQSGWMEWFKEYLRAPGQWYLVRKTDRLIMATMLVYEGEQPYYVAKHVGFTSVSNAGPKGETINYGIGKKRLDGHVDRIWIMANGCVTLGDDVEQISLTLLKQGLV
jgi:hypothetical protein